MKNRATIAACAAVACALAVRPQAQQPQTFRASAEVVIVDVSVRQGGQPVAGLTAADFVVLDNGVRQEVERIETASVPIDLTVVADLSYNHAGGIARLQTDVTQLTTQLRPLDRIRVLVFDDHVRELVPFQRVAEAMTIAFDRDGHLASLTDAIIMALSTPVEPDRRHVVIVRTRGHDTISLTAVPRIRDVAATSDAQLHVVFDEMAVWGARDLAGFQCRELGNCQATHRFWQPFQKPSQMVSHVGGLVLAPYGLAIEEAARLTGGAVHFTQIFRAPTLLSAFDKAFETFRQSYVLRYVPRGVAREGWHDITVTVPGHRRADVRSRRGYGVDPPVPDDASRVLFDAEMPDDLRRIVTAYDTGDHPQVVTALAGHRDVRQLIERFRELANPWPAEPWHEAVFAVELAEAAVFSTNADTRKAGLELLAAQSRLIRHPFEADDYERYWHWTTTAMAQGTLRSGEIAPVIDAALARFPDDPRFALGRAIVADQAWTFHDRRTVVRGPARPPFHDAVAPFYRAAFQSDTTAHEARVRLAWGLHRQGDHAGALALLRQTTVSAEDLFVAYIRELFEGHALAALGKHDEAIDAYRRASTWLPAAQSARVSLMNTLLFTGRAADRIEAEALAERVQTDRDTVADPWWYYWQGDYRFFPSLLDHMRGRRR